MKRKLLSMILVLAMLTTLAPVSVFAEGEPAAVTEEAEVQAAPVPEPTAEPTPEPTQAPTPEPTQAPTPEPTAVPTEEPEQAPAAEPEKEAPVEPAEAPAPESAEAHAPVPEKKTEPENTASEPEPVKVEFRPVPDGAKLTVFTKDEKGNKEEIKPEKDGSFLLLPGRYFYTLEAEGFEAVEEKELEVKASAKPVEVIPELVPIAEPAEEDEAVPAVEDIEETAELIEKPVEEPVPAEPTEEETEAPVGKEPAAADAAKESEAPIEEENPEEAEESAPKDMEPEHAEETEKAEEAEEIEETEAGTTTQTAANAVVFDLVLDTDYDVSLDYENSVVYFSITPEQTGTYVFSSTGSEDRTYCTVSKNGDKIQATWGDYDFTLQCVLEAGYKYTYSVQYDSDWTWVPGSFTVRLTKLPFSVTPVGDTYISLYPGETTELAVTVEGDTAGLSYQWYTYGEPIPNAQGPSLTVEAESREYEIYVTDGSSSQSVYFNVTVNNDFRAWAADSKDKESWIDFYVAPNERVELKVAFEARDEDSVSLAWYADGIFLEDEQGTSYTTSPIKSYSYFECYVYDTYGNGASVGFYVYVDNDFSAYVHGTKTTSIDYTVDVTGSRTLEIDVDANDTSGLEIRWYKNYEEIEEEHGTTLDTGSITTYTEFSCEVNDGYGNYQNVYFYISVRMSFSAHIKGSYKTFQTIPVELGDTPTLEIEIEADDPNEPLTIRWEKDGEPIESATGSTSLTADPVERGTSYYCYVSDQYGNYEVLSFYLKYGNNFSAYVKGTTRTYMTLEVNPGDTPSLELEITADDTSGITIEWYKNSAFLPDETESVLVTDPIKRYTEYLCEISDGYGNSQSINFYIFVDNELTAYVAGTDKTRDKISVSPGDSTTLAVDISAKDMSGLEIEWDRGGTFIEGANEAILNLSDIQETSEYTCFVSDGYGNAAYVHFDVHVENGFTATMNGSSQEYQTIRVNVGETVTMNVDASATSGQISYEWNCWAWNLENGFWDWEDLDFTGPTLTTDPIYGGMSYYCSVFDQYGNSKNFHVEIEIDNHLTVHAGNETDENDRIPVDYGNKTTLNVIASADTGDLTYSWFVDYYNTDGSWAGEEDLYVNSSSIETVSITSPCRYYCTVSDIYGSNIQVEFYVVVKSGLTVQSGTEMDNNGDVIVKVGDTATLTVLASVDIGELTYTWNQIFYDEAGNWTGQRDLPVSGNSFVTDPITKYSWYQCIVTDDFGSTAGVRFNVIVDNKLTASMGNETNNNGQIPVPWGETVELRVNAYAEMGDLSYQWYESSGYWTLIEGATGPRFVTPRVTEAKDYICVVTDIYGTIRNVWFDVTVENNLKAYVAGTSRDWADLYVNLGESPIMNVEASANTGTLNYQWHIIRDPHEKRIWQEFGNTGPSCTGEPVDEYVEYYCEVTDMYGGRAGVWFNIHILNDLTAYVKDTTRDWADVHLGLGETTEMSVTATAASGTLTYQWYIIRDPNGSWDWEEIPKAKSASCTSEPVERYTVYVCEVMDTYGSVADVWFNVYVNAPSDFTIQPVGETYRTVKAGDDVTLAVEVDGIGEFTYEWREIHEIWGEGWSTGSNTNTLTLTNIQKSGEYMCFVYDQYGNGKDISFKIVIDNNFRVIEPVTALPWDWFVVDVFAGNDVPLKANAVADSGDITYTWYRYSKQYWDYTQVQSGNDSEYIVPTATAGSDSYCCRVTDKYGTAITLEFEFGVDNQLKAYVEDTTNTWVDITVEAGKTTSLGVTASAASGDLTYRWFKETYDSSGESTGYEQVSGNGSKIITDEINMYTGYWCEVTDDYENTASVWFYVYVDNNLMASVAGTSDTWAQIYVADGATATLSVDASAANGSLIYRWFKTYEDEYGNWYDELIPGAASSSFTTPAISGYRGEDTIYFCRVTDQYNNPFWVYFYIQNADIVIYSNNKVLSEGFRIMEGRSRTLTVKTVDGIPINDPTWEISDVQSEQEGMDVISIDSDGVLKAIGVGVAKLTATYNESSQSVLITVIADTSTVTEIAVIPPDKTEYEIGESFDPTGLRVTATFSDGFSRELDSTEYMLSELDSTEAGEKTITVTYIGNDTITATFTVTIVNLIKSIAVTPPDKTVYEIGEEFDPTGIGVTATYSDKSTRLLGSDEYDLSDFSSDEEGEKTITVTYIDNDTITATFTVTIVNLIKSIVVTSLPNKSEYEIGDTFDPTGLKVAAVMSDGSRQDLEDTAYVLDTTGFDSSTAGEKTITVIYGDGADEMTVTFAVTVAIRITGIAVTGLPDKTVYEVNEEYKGDGLKVNVLFSDSSSRELDSTEYTIKDFSSAEVGVITVTVIYGDFTATFTVTIINPVKSIAVTTLPDKTEYEIDETLDLAGLKVTATYSDKTTKELTEDDYTVDNSGFDSSAPGEKAITVTYKDNDTITTTFTVTVNELKAGLNLDTEDFTLVGGKTKTITARDNEGNKLTDVEWTVEIMWATREKVDVVTVTGGVVKAISIGAATITATRDRETASVTVTTLFTDVTDPAKQFYFDPVYWAAQNGVTTGTSATEFAPNQACTRGQIVTFLWRAYGSPKPSLTTNPFKDVKSDAYYYDAVLWAVENDITTGTSATTFAPNAPCTRGHIVTFLWRAAGSPEPTSTKNPFKDVKSGAFYYKAVLWAVENNITTGTSATTFEPNKACTRGQCVTFLMRAVA